MNQSKGAQAKVILRTGKKFSDGTSPIVLYFKRKGENIYLTPYPKDKRFRTTAKKWDKENGLFIKNKRLNPEYADLNIKILEAQDRVDNIIDQFEDDTWVKKDFLRIYNKEDVTDNFCELVEQRNLSNKKVSEATATNYKSFVRMFCNEIKYFPDFENLRVCDIDYDFIQSVIDYGNMSVWVTKAEAYRERWNEGHMSKILTFFRTHLNHAKRLNINMPKHYPFYEEGSTKPYHEILKVKATAEKRKKAAIAPSHFKKLIEYTPYNFFIMNATKFYCFYRRLEIPWMRAVRLRNCNFIKTTSGDTTTYYLQTNEYKVKLEGIELEAYLWFQKYQPGKNGYAFPFIEDDNDPLLYDQLKTIQSQQIKALDRIKVKINSNASDPLFAKKLLTYTEYKEHLVYAQKMFLFSYYAGGMNWVDMALLTPDNIHISMADGEEYEELCFKREKTKKDNSDLIVLHYGDKLKEIVGYFEENDKPYKNYLLPIVDQNFANLSELKKRIDVRRRSVNTAIKQLAILAGLPPQIAKHLKFYDARHTMATNLINSGATILDAKEILGHRNIAVTMEYIGPTDHAKKKQLADSLIIE